MVVTAWWSSRPGPFIIMEHGWECFNIASNCNWRLIVMAKSFWDWHKIKTLNCKVMRWTAINCKAIPCREVLVNLNTQWDFVRMAWCQEVQQRKTSSTVWNSPGSMGIGREMGKVLFSDEATFGLFETSEKEIV